RFIRPSPWSGRTLPKTGGASGSQVKISPYRVLFDSDAKHRINKNHTLIVQNVVAGSYQDFSFSFQVPEIPKRLSSDQNYYTRIQIWQPRRFQVGSARALLGTFLYHVSTHTHLRIRQTNSGIARANLSETDRPVRVFIAYAAESEHKPWIEQLVLQLRAHGFDVWFDRDRLKGGHVPTEINLEIERADVVVPLCTPLYIEKWRDGRDWVGKEKQKILARMATGCQIVPIVIQGNHASLPLELQPYQTVDMGHQGWRGEAFGDLTRFILHLHASKAG
ncbi:toll/interleukin-1 receptor domain-containing protein, partial [Mesorhizobium sp. 98Argb]